MGNGHRSAATAVGAYSSAAMKAQHVLDNDVDRLRVVRALPGAVAGPGIVGGGSSPA
jgi:hypothetical protein